MDKELMKRFLFNYSKVEVSVDTSTKEDYYLISDITLRNLNRMFTKRFRSFNTDPILTKDSKVLFTPHAKYGYPTSFIKNAARNAGAKGTVLLQNANTILINSDTDVDVAKSFGNSVLWGTTSFMYVSTETDTLLIKTSKTNVFPVVKFGRSFESAYVNAEFLRVFLILLNKEFTVIESDDFSKNFENSLSDELFYENLKNCLGSSDTTIVKLGLNLLFNAHVSDDPFRLQCLMNSYSGTIRYESSGVARAFKQKYYAFSRNILQAVKEGDILLNDYDEEPFRSLIKRSEVYQHCQDYFKEDVLETITIKPSYFKKNNLKTKEHEQTVNINT